MSRRTSGRLDRNVVIAVLAGVLAMAAPDASGLANDNRAADENVQKMCPVMTGNRISRDIYTDYKSKRVYFCCENCRASFLADPEKYLPRLPQFASGEQSEQSGEYSGQEGFMLGQLIVPTGITTLSLVVLTVCLPLLRRVKRLNIRVILKIHKICGICAMCMGIAHATIIFLAG